MNGVQHSDGERRRVHLEIQGTVQGVGFRPFVHGLATRLNLGGKVYNHSLGVALELEGPPERVEEFLSGFGPLLPPLATLESVALEEISPCGEESFRIMESVGGSERFTLISPDVATCPECLREITDSAHRRHGYPFTNCTHCGPRFTVIQDIPYDRKHTTMSVFPMCPQCRREYTDPTDRRFHAEPTACPVCGPELRLTGPDGFPLSGDPLQGAVEILSAGRILAVKGLGGYHLACDGENPEAVGLLRTRKHRDEKPFAVMVRNLQDARRLCHVDSVEAQWLESPAHPIVLLEKREPCPAAAAIAPGFRELGVMLPYTPLHHLMLQHFERAMVLTSGNLSDEPIAYRDEDAYTRLRDLADGFLTHNREIHIRTDDSVVRVWNGVGMPIRRSRGFAPQPVSLSHPVQWPVLACGGELKNTFCLARDRHAFLSHHIGDLENLETLESFRTGIDHFKNLFQIEPEVIAYDLHPDYLSTRYALEMEEVLAGKIRTIGVQHHHAHMAACMADNGLDGEVIGVAYDGTGYGTDGNLWGGEILVGDLREYHRMAHWSYFPLPGGSQAIREPWRIALSLAWQQLGQAADDPQVFQQVSPPIALEVAKHGAHLVAMMERGVNSPLACGVGRLFDAASALLTGRVRVTFEGQAAMALEQLADPAETGAFPLDWSTRDRMCQPDGSLLLQHIVRGLQQKVPAPVLAARFHNTIAQVTAALCVEISLQTELHRVVLSGGVFQNRLLLTRTVQALERVGLRWYFHRSVPANDGGLSLGQAVIAGARACA